ncbi:31117_t:CDS:2, partial [Gigaspora margarita]
CLAEKPKKHNEDLTFANIEMYHYTHSSCLDNSISLEIKQYILENIDLLSREIFRSKKWLIENSHQIIIQKESPQAIGFLSRMWNMINSSRIQINEIGVDSISDIYWPIYSLKIMKNCNNGIRTSVLVDFFSKLYLLGLNPEFLLTNKDFSQISATRFVWKNIKVQLCLWHIKRAIENRLSNNTKPKQIIYNSQMAHNQFHFIDPEFRPQLNIANYVFCPKQFRSAIWEMMNRHLHQHPLIPTNTGQYLTSQQIWTIVVQEVYNFCQQHLLTYL